MVNNVYKNNIVTGQQYKPLLHKKGKQWIVVGISSLLLAGLGAGINMEAPEVSANVLPKANNVGTKAILTNQNTNHNQSTPVQHFAVSQPAQLDKVQSHQSASVANTKQVTSSASQIHTQLMNNQVHNDAKQSEANVKTNASKVVPSATSYASSSATSFSASAKPQSQLSNSTNSSSTSAKSNLSNLHLGLTNLNAKANTQPKHFQSHNLDADPDTSTITLNFTNENNNAIVLSKQYTGKIGSDFDSSDNILDNTPNGYNLDSITSDADKFTNNNQTVTVDLIPESCTMNVNYYDSSDSHLITTEPATSVTGATFNIDQFLQNLPSGYEEAKVISNIPATYSDGTNINIQVTPLADAQNLDINHASDKVNYQYNGKTMTSQKFSGNKGSDIDITSSNATLPANYHLTNSDTKETLTGKSDSVAITPNQLSDTITYQTSDGAVIATNKYTGNNVNAQGASDTSFNANTDMPNGYHATSNTNFSYDGNPHTVTIAKNTNKITLNVIDKNNNNKVLNSYEFNVPVGSLPDVQFGNIVPSGYYPVSDGKFDSKTNNINLLVSNQAQVKYIYKGKTISSPTETLVSDGKMDSFNINQNFITNNVPKGYNAGIGNYENSTPVFDVPLSPKQATDEIDYQYNGQTIASTTKSGNDSDAQDASDTTFDITSNNDTNIPSNYHLVNKDNKFSYDGQPKDVEIAPNQATDTITYETSNGTPISAPQTYSGNTANAKNAQNTSFNANNNVPTNYHAVSNTTFNYDGSNHTVTIAPNTESDTVTYINNKGKQISSKNIKGNYNSDAKTSIDNNVPSNWHIVSGDAGKFAPNQQFKATIAPNQATDNISFETSNGNVINTKSYTGNNSNAQGASDTSFDAKKDVPANYHATGTTSFNYDGGNHTVNIAPNSETDTVTYSDGKGHQISSAPITGSYNTSAQNDINKNVPNGYHAVSTPTGKFTPNGKFNVIVAPNQATTKISYNLSNGNSVGSYTYSGADTDTFDAKNNVPSNYHVVNNENTQFKYGTKVPSITVVPNTESDTVTYVNNKGKTISSQSIKGNYSSDAQSTLDSHIPKNWDVVSGDTGTFAPNKTFTVTIKPKQTTNTIDYQYKGKTQGTTSMTGNSSDAQGASDTSFDINKSNEPNIPTGYHLVNTDNQFSYDGKTNDVKIAPNQANDEITYQTSDGKVITTHTYTGNTDTAQGASDTSFNANSFVPNNYHATSNTKFSYNGKPEVVIIAKNQTTDKINFVSPSGKQISSTTISGDVNSDKIVSAPTNYKIKGNNTVKLNGEPQTITIVPKVISQVANVHLVYKEDNGKVDDTKTVHVHVRGQNGTQFTIYPSDYDRDNYADDNDSDTFTIQNNMQPTDKVLNPTFTYVGRSAGNIAIRYIDTEPDTIHYNRVVGTQTLPSLGVVGSTVYLGAKGVFSGSVFGNPVYNLLIAPEGWHFVSAINPIALRLHRGRVNSKGVRCMYLNLFFTGKSMKKQKKTNINRPTRKPAQLPQTNSTKKVTPKAHAINKAIKPTTVPVKPIQSTKVNKMAKKVAKVQNQTAQINEDNAKLIAEIRALKAKPKVNTDNHTTTAQRTPKNISKQKPKISRSIKPTRITTKHAKFVTKLSPHHYLARTIKGMTVIAKHHNHKVAEPIEAIRHHSNYVIIRLTNGRVFKQSRRPVLRLFAHHNVKWTRRSYKMIIRMHHHKITISIVGIVKHHGHVTIILSNGKHVHISYRQYHKLVHWLY